jgi:hypothetical protein
MEKAGQQTEAIQRLIGAMHHFKLISKDLTLMAAQIINDNQTFSHVIRPATGGIPESTGHWTLPDKGHMRISGRSI